MCRQEARRGGAIVDRLCFFTAFFPLVPPRLNMLMRMTMHHRIDQRTSLGCVLGSVHRFGSPNSMDSSSAVAAVRCRSSSVVPSAKKIEM